MNVHKHEPEHENYKYRDLDKPTYCRHCGVRIVAENRVAIRIARIAILVVCLILTDIVIQYKHDNLLPALIMEAAIILAFWLSERNLLRAIRWRETTDEAASPIEQKIPSADDNPEWKK